MHPWIEKTYYRCPVFLQNIATSTYGYYLHKTRYGGDSQATFDKLMEAQWYSSAEIKEYQRSKLKEIIHNAYRNVPYYADLLNSLKLSPGDINDINDLSKISFLEKESIRRYSGRLINRNIKGKVLKLYTSGTSGSPLEIQCDLEGRRYHYLFLRRFRAWFGVELGMCRASFFGRIVLPPSQKKPPFWRYDIAENNYIFSSYHMSEKNLRFYCDKLQEIGPVEICGYPSSLHTISKYMKDNNIRNITPSFIMTTAETLMDHQRDIIEESLNCKVRDQYGCTEMAIFVSQCESGTYHVNPEYGLIEVVDSEGNVVEDGEEGEVVCTSFINKVMPLIRYRLGDSIKLGKTSCSCGRSFQVVEMINGRIDDILLTPDGKPLGRMDPIFKGGKGIREAQIIQTSSDSLQFNIVKDAFFNEEYERSLLYEIKKRTGDSMKIKLNFVNEIPRGKAGKFRTVISAIEQ